MLHLLPEKLPNIILGSASSRRKELLKKMGLKFKIHALNVDESYPDSIPSQNVAEHIAKIKMEHLSSLYDANDLLITADTVVRYKNEILGKPTSKENSIDILEKLSGEKHIVTSACVLNFHNKTICFSEDTEVHFEEINKDIINHYVSNYNPFDKAGSYGIQDWIGFIGVKKIIGSYNNVVGLPTSSLYKNLLEIL